MPESKRHSEENQSRESRGATRDGVFKYLATIHNSPSHSTYFEIELEKAGLISRLEMLGILPRAANPNPYNPLEQQKEHDQWTSKHSSDMEKFTQRFEKRNEIIKHLFIGAVLGHIFGELFPQNASTGTEDSPLK